MPLLLCGFDNTFLGSCSNRTLFTLVTWNMGFTDVSSKGICKYILVVNILFLAARHRGSPIGFTRSGIWLI